MSSVDMTCHHESSYLLHLSSPVETVITCQDCLLASPVYEPYIVEQRI